MPAAAETPYQPGALAPLLSLWGQVMPSDTPGPARLRDVMLLDPAFRPEGLRLLWQDGQLIGFAYAVADCGQPADSGSRRGWLVALGVAPHARRSGHGGRLLASCLRFLSDAGCGTAEIGGHGERYLVPGVDSRAYPGFGALLGSQGFRRTGSTVAMSCDLRAHPPGGAAAPSGEYDYRHPREGDLPELLRMVAEHFSPGWSGLLRRYLAASEDTERLWIADGPEGIAGFAGRDLFPGCPGRFGPMGVIERVRGQGIGGRLLRMSLASMARAGHPSAWFLWGPDGTAGHRMYESAGFRVTREFGFFARPLSLHARAQACPGQESS
jgi:GNAT superfamily N-acetyltransferase